MRLESFNVFTAKCWRDLHALVQDRAWRLVGYGVNPLALLIAFIVAIGLGTWLFYQPNAVCLAKSDATCTSIGQMTLGGAAWYSIAMFSPVDLPSTVKLLPTSAQVFGVSVEVVAGILKIAGWIIIPTLVATLAGWLRRSGQGSPS